MKRITKLTGNILEAAAWKIYRYRVSREVIRIPLGMPFFALICQFSILFVPFESVVGAVTPHFCPDLDEKSSAIVAYQAIKFSQRPALSKTVECLFIQNYHPGHNNSSDHTS